MIYAVTVLNLINESEFRRRLNDIKSRSIPVYDKYNNFFLIQFSGTTRDLSDMLGFENGGVGSGVVMSLGAYWGRANGDMWEWIGTHREV